MHDVGGHVRELDGTLVDGLDEELSELRLLLNAGVDGLDELLFEIENDVGDVATADELKRDAQALALYFHVGGGEDAEDVHDEVVEDTSVVFGSQVLYSVKYDGFDVVVGLFDDEVDVSRGGS